MPVAPLFVGCGPVTADNDGEAEFECESDINLVHADSGASRSAFRDEADQRSDAMPITDRAFSEW